MKLLTGEPNIKSEALSDALDSYYRKASESSWCPSEAVETAVVTLTGPWSLKGDVDDIGIDFHALIEWEHTERSFQWSVDWEFPFIHLLKEVKVEKKDLYCTHIFNETQLEWLVPENIQNNGGQTDWSPSKDENCNLLGYDMDVVKKQIEQDEKDVQVEIVMVDMWEKLGKLGRELQRKRDEKAIEGVATFLKERKEKRKGQKSKDKRGKKSS